MRETMRQWIEDTVKALVDAEGQVRVVEFPATQSVTYEVYVADEDFGKIVGEKGKHADALRILMNAMSRKYKFKYMLTLMDPKRSAPTPHQSR